MTDKHTNRSTGIIEQIFVPDYGLWTTETYDRVCSELPILFKTVHGSVARSRCSRPSVEGWEPVSSADLHEDTVSFVVQRCAVVVDKITRRLFIKNTQ